MTLFYALALVGCAPNATPDADPLPPDYSAPGPWTAATAGTTIIGSTGVSLPVQVWYPTLETEGTAVIYQGMLQGAALENASPDCGEAHPLVAFSHGSGGMRWQSPFFTEFLATHGWVVVAPDHTGNTFLDSSGSIADIALRRPQDLVDSVDWLLSDATYVGCTDAADGYAVVGHSFGGYTTYAAAGAVVNDGVSSYELGDDRVWAGVAWAPWDVDGLIVDGAAEITVPMATLGGTLDETLSWASQENLHNHVTSLPRALGEFPKAGHFSFSPVACTVAAYEGDGCGEEFIDLDLFTSLVNTSTLSFLANAHGVEGTLDQLPPDSDDLHWTVVE